jgi:signal transduction histidine kinase
MKRPQTLRSRIVYFFCGYLFALLAVYSGALFGAIHLAEDMAFNRQLSEFAGQIAQHLENHGELPANLPMHISAYADLASVPEQLREHVADRRPGVFEIDPTSLNYHAALVRLPSTGRMLYVFFNVESIEAASQFDSHVTAALVGLGLFVLFLGWLLARSLSNRILNPITELAAAVQRISPDHEATGLDSFDAPDEVGALSAKINQLLKRISDFTRREREFTAHASHELRTPITVIKGAMEILHGRVDMDNPAVNRPMARVQRATTDIEMLIDTFLLLARQEQHPDQDAACHLPNITQNVVDSYRCLLEAKPVSVTLSATDSGTIQAPASLVTIALGNLVRNAFQYTMRGRVEVVAGADRVSVTDSGPGINDSRQDAGLGLTIVKRLCDRMGWRFTIAGSPKGGTRVDLIFSVSGTGKENPEAEPG